MQSLKETLEKTGMLTTLNQNLEKSYNEALKNKEFKDFVGLFNLDKNILMKYTSTLEGSCKEYGNCKNCKNLNECKNKIKGYAYLPTVNNEKLTFGYKACKFENNYLKETKHLKNITLLQTPEGFLNANVKKIYTDDAARFEAVKWVTTFIKEYPNVKKGLYLHGNFGCGKSYIISAMLIELAKQNVKSTIVFWPEFLRHLKCLIGSNDEIEQIIYRVKNTPILFIDDIGAENLTAWGRDDILSTILDYRMNNGYITFFTSNLNLKELETHLSQTREGVEVIKARRIMERIKQMTESIELISKNLRNK